MAGAWRPLTELPPHRIRVRWRGTLSAVRTGATYFYADRRRFARLGYYAPNGVKELDRLPPDPEDRVFEYWQQFDE
jgi:hypothetical protein